MSWYFHASNFCLPFPSMTIYSVLQSLKSHNYIFIRAIFFQLKYSHNDFAGICIAKSKHGKPQASGSEEWEIFLESTSTIEPCMEEDHRIPKQNFNFQGFLLLNITFLLPGEDSSGLGRVDIRKTVAQIKDEGLGRSEKTDRFCYEACPLLVGDRQCNKKVTNNGDGRWQSEMCDQSFPLCDYRYLLQLQIQDHTGLTWVTA
ncbi:hypothetical protein H6P81_011507 [Aristolochia fimbriata]|uniref:Replication factor A C-terminal domain-containing protein n=1 Tax=Aristolochia fimbriata TaxID=158543 RepID=A0AAV7EV81_ARIFI|nr:hypothetical protein H6P81_011507 [Aristolochia fimbriata]